MISGWARADLPVGLAAVAAAAWTSLRLLPAGGSRLRLASLAALALSFMRQFVVSGMDVARRALHPRLQLRPGFVVYLLHLPPGGAQSAHCLDVDQPVGADLAAEQSLFIRALGHE
jgi:multicomponent Na+:H+ antiporter subunit E